jgi:hypothetical protein
MQSLPIYIFLYHIPYFLIKYRGITKLGNFAIEGCHQFLKNCPSNGFFRKGKRDIFDQEILYYYRIQNHLSTELFARKQNNSTTWGFNFPNLNAIKFLEYLRWGMKSNIIKPIHIIASTLKSYRQHYNIMIFDSNNDNNDDNDDNSRDLSSGSNSGSEGGGGGRSSSNGSNSSGRSSISSGEGGGGGDGNISSNGSNGSGRNCRGGGDDDGGGEGLGSRRNNNRNNNNNNSNSNETLYLGPKRRSYVQLLKTFK